LLPLSTTRLLLVAPGRLTRSYFLSYIPLYIYTLRSIRYSLATLLPYLDFHSLRSFPVGRVKTIAISSLQTPPPPPISLFFCFGSGHTTPPVDSYPWTFFSLSDSPKELPRIIALHSRSLESCETISTGEP
jgi:hypothetical protein